MNRPIDPIPAPDIRPVRPEDHAALLSLWERSVRATHGFLAEADIAFYRPFVSDILTGETLELWVLTRDKEVPIGFQILSHQRIEGLFLEPSQRRRGWGRRFVEHAQQRWKSSLSVDVNEQNVAARRFYEALGFVAVGRSPIDDMGRPFPILHLRRDRP